MLPSKLIVRGYSMTAKAVTIDSDSIRPSDLARNLKIPINPLRSFKELSRRNQVLVVTFLIVAITGVMLAISQVFGAGDQKDSMNTANNSNTSSSDQQPPKDSNGQPSTSSNTNTNTGTSSNTNSTNITVNGQAVDVPQSGAYDKSMNVSGTNVHVSGNSSQSTTGGSATNSSSTNVQINSE